MNEQKISDQNFNEPQRDTSQDVDLSASKQMPKYKSHKEVWALKIKDIKYDIDLSNIENRETDGSAEIIPENNEYYSFKVNATYLKKHNPQIGGYFVVYEGGYESWSPAKEFEEGYTLIK